MHSIFAFLIPLAFAGSDVREVTATSCEVIRVNLGLGMTTQIVLEQEPKVTLYADKRHFKIKSNSQASRSLAIIPHVESSELDTLRGGRGEHVNSTELASRLDKSFKTNLFVFFESNNQLMFELRFVEKEKADYVLKVKQKFNKDCTL